MPYIKRYVMKPIKLYQLVCKKAAPLACRSAVKIKYGSVHLFGSPLPIVLSRFRLDANTSQSHVRQVINIELLI